MIEPMSHNDRAYSDAWDDYPMMTKFIGRDGTGHRGSIICTMDGGTRAKLVGLTGEFTDKIVYVRETDPEQWPVVAKKRKRDA